MRHGSVGGTKVGKRLGKQRVNGENLLVAKYREMVQAEAVARASEKKQNGQLPRHVNMQLLENRQCSLKILVVVSNMRIVESGIW